MQLADYFSKKYFHKDDLDEKYVNKVFHLHIINEIISANLKRLSSLV